MKCPLAERDKRGKPSSWKNGHEVPNQRSRPVDTLAFTAKLRVVNARLIAARPLAHGNADFLG